MMNLLESLETLVAEQDGPTVRARIMQIYIELAAIIADRLRAQSKRRLTETTDS
jgi:hypothetical protein